jgi:hypothetical protein
MCIPQRITISRAMLACLAIPLVALLAIGGCPMDDGSNGSGDPPKGNSGLTGKYVGSARCLTCHRNVHNDWEQTLHARAFDTLERIGQSTNPMCVGCHVVGFGEPGGFVNRATTNDLAGVGCESCHGPSRDHVENVNDESLHPPKNISSAVCGSCHTGDHHPNFDDWQTAGHSAVTPGPAASFTAGTSLNACGKCHSGEFFYRAILNGETVPDDFLKDVPAAEQHAIECVICHNPHARTGNAVQAEDGRDYQLRFREVANPIPTNTIDAVTNPARFNLCGQCHHDRGRTWEEVARPPHHSNQANMYVGEMPLPEDGDLLVFSRRSVHAGAPEQCATCHMYRQDFQNEFAPAISGHTFQVNLVSCAAVCHQNHPSLENAQAALAVLQAEVQGRLDAIKSRLNAWATTTHGVANGWEYRSSQTAVNQNQIPNWVKQTRFLYYYTLNDGSLGVHNPDYTRGILSKSEELLTANGQ